MRMRLTALAVAIAGTTVVFTQSPSSATFDVVSIKKHVAQPGPMGLSSNVNMRPDGGFTMTNIPVMTLIARAYEGIRPADLVGLPDWARSERYDVSATSTLAKASADDRAAMLRAMLEDRFKFVAHVEPREQQVFDLLLARDDRRLGTGLTKIDADCAAVVADRAAEAERTGQPATPRQLPDFKAPPPTCTLRVVGAPMRDKLGDGQGRAGDLMEGEATMAELAMAFRMSTGRIVVDKTGLAGSYRVRMNFSGMMGARLGPSTAPAQELADAIPTVFTAVREQLGLKLESSRAQLDTLIIDRIERPTEN